MPEHYGDVGLAFDAANNPVIAYRGDPDSTGSDRYYLAYDPIVAPEPATAALLMTGMALALRRRRG